MSTNENGPKYICQGCGAEYTGYAEYCNHCGSTTFVREGQISVEVPSLRADFSILWVQATLWLLVLLYFVGIRSLDAITLLWTWAGATAFGVLAGLVTKHLRAALLFSGLGALFMLLAWAIRSE